MLCLPQTAPSLPSPYTKIHRSVVLVSCPAQLAESCYPINDSKLRPAAQHKQRLGDTSTGQKMRSPAALAEAGRPERAAPSRCVQDDHARQKP
jgi:hypothetical protein